MTRRDFLYATTLIWAATIAAALAVALVPRAATAAREAFGFTLHAPLAGSWSDVATYFVANLRVVAAVFLASWARPRCGRLRPALDALVALTAAVNAGVLGAAIGAYGSRLVPSLLHVPLEWAALAAALGTYRASRRIALSLSCMLAGGVAAGVLLVAAAVVEVFATR